MLVGARSTRQASAVQILRAHGGDAIIATPGPPGWGGLQSRERWQRGVLCDQSAIWSCARQCAAAPASLLRLRLRWHAMLFAPSCRGPGGRGVRLIVVQPATLWWALGRAAPCLRTCAVASAGSEPDEAAGQARAARVQGRDTCSRPGPSYFSPRGRVTGQRSSLLGASPRTGPRIGGPCPPPVALGASRRGSSTLYWRGGPAARWAEWAASARALRALLRLGSRPSRQPSGLGVKTRARAVSAAVPPPGAPCGVAGGGCRA